jgi:hypothetical membrane protein
MGAGDIEEVVMTTVWMTQDRGQTMPRPVRSASIVRKVLLSFGILSSLLYVATDLLGGMRYEGYSFTSQAISELAAVGAPSKPLVDPLFITYDLLALAFGIGVFREAGRRNRALRITATMLMAYGAIGFAAAVFAGPAFFAMHQRGVGSLASDAPHIILTAVLVLLLLLAMGFGTLALAKRFRVYSFATVLTVIVFGALTSMFAARLAAGQPTPGMGIVERIDVYSALLWLAVLGVALLRRPWYGGERSLP